jgi:hypothetical protein
MPVRWERERRRAALHCDVGEEGWATPMKEQMVRHTGYAVAWWHVAGMDGAA